MPKIAGISRLERPQLPLKSLDYISCGAAGAHISKGAIFPIGLSNPAQSNIVRYRSFLVWDKLQGVLAIVSWSAFSVAPRSAAAGINAASGSLRQGNGNGIAAASRIIPARRGRRKAEPTCRESIAVDHRRAHALRDRWINQAGNKGSGDVVFRTIGSVFGGLFL